MTWLVCGDESTEKTGRGRTRRPPREDEATEKMGKRRRRGIRGKGEAIF